MHAVEDRFAGRAGELIGLAAVPPAARLAQGNDCANGKVEGLCILTLAPAQEGLRRRVEGTCHLRKHVSIDVLVGRHEDSHFQCEERILQGLHLDGPTNG